MFPKAVTGGWEACLDNNKCLNLATFQNLFVLSNHFFDIHWTHFAIGTKSNTIFPYVSEIENALTTSEINALTAISNHACSAMASLRVLICSFAQ